MVGSDQVALLAEQRAEEAENLPAFSGFKLLHVKRHLKQLLAQIGKDGVFREYTVHDVDHIDSMLRSLEWLIPGDTQKLMQPADWLLLVLSVYFHDLGMLVTKDEFEQRDRTSFPAFRAEIMRAESGDGRDYAANLEILDEVDRELFLYQEFVRKNHAERVEHWVQGSLPEAMGISTAAVAELDVLLQHLPPTFREDLGAICHSHHLDDLDNVIKYPVSKPYGNGPREAANVQYAAVLLRTADLLHVTSDRTPTVMFRLISPRDPVSQAEWAKQRSVQSIRSKLGVNAEGIVEPSAPRDTIEVHASFTDETGFFGLTSYLDYATREIQQSHQWIKTSRESAGATFQFPWRRIDQSNVVARGFIAQEFQFTFDQAKILDLLTGHTLYNDTNVVIREIVQNSVDAVRLQFLEENSASKDGRVTVEWSPEAKILSVWGNGTGMTQEIIESHLLKVGSSRYQDPKFRERYPDFSPISRFGIGVLSAFMIADKVEIVTFAESETVGRRLLLRDVHGRYLIRLVPPGSDEIAQRIGQHGTLVRLHLRPSADLDDVAAICRGFFVVPGVRISVDVAGDEVVAIGFQSVKAALESALAELETSPDARPASPDSVTVTQVEVDGTSVAFALRWDPWFDEWRFVEAPSSPDPAEIAGRLGCCVEGIRIESGTPGYRGTSFLAIANVTGPNAPKTNVARSGIEGNQGGNEYYRRIYRAVLSHLQSERERTASFRSVTAQADEVGYLIRPTLHVREDISRGGAELRSSEIFWEELRMVPTLLMEQDGGRQIVSIDHASNLPSFWTVDSAFFRHADWLIREIPGDSSYGAMIGAVGGGSMKLPSGPILCATNALRHAGLFPAFGPSQFVATPAERRIDIEWTASARADWFVWDGRAVFDDLIRMVQRSFAVVQRFTGLRVPTGVWVPRADVGTLGFTDQGAVRRESTLFLLPKSPFVPILTDSIERAGNSSELLVALNLIENVFRMTRRDLVEEVVEVCSAAAAMLGDKAVLDWPGLIACLQAPGQQVYDVSRWQRSDAESEAP